jgi:hypothetical protein
MGDEEVGMSILKNLIAILPHPQAELIQSLVAGTSPSVQKRVCRDAVMRQQPGGLMCRLGAFVHECGIRIMDSASERAESGNGP